MCKALISTAVQNKAREAFQDKAKRPELWARPVTDQTRSRRERASRKPEGNKRQAHISCLLKQQQKKERKRLMNLVAEADRKRLLASLHRPSMRSKEKQIDRPKL
jgi:hypothetical protein